MEEFSEAINANDNLFNPNTADKDGVTLGMHAEVEKNNVVLELLTKHKDFDLDIEDNEGRTIFDYAEHYQNEEAVDILHKFENLNPVEDQL